LETGSFISRDPLGFVDGPNVYTYVNDNPWTHFDPEGLASDNDKNFFQKAWDTVGHFFKGTLGKNGSDQKINKEGASNPGQSAKDGWQKNIHAAVFSSDNDPKNNGQTNAATGQLMGKDEKGVALPDAKAKGKAVQVQNVANGKTVDTKDIDTGPHYTDNPYWEKGERPKAEIRGNLYLSDKEKYKQYKHDKNRAGIDLSPATMKALGIPVAIVKTSDGPEWQTTGPAEPKVNWRFITK